jgi:tRNA (guanine6-N2)-methyltransferase
VTLAKADLAARLPLPDESVDAVLVDLPFGKRHKSNIGISRLYALGLAEVCRVLRAEGVVVALTTHKKLLSRVVEAQPLLQPVLRREICLGGLMTYAIKARRKSSST